MTNNNLLKDRLNNRKSSERGSDRMFKIKRKRKHSRNNTVRKQEKDYVKLDLEMLSLLL